MSKPILFFLCVVLFFSCAPLKQLKLLKSGSVQQNGYTETIPFELRAGVPIIAAVVNGQKGYFLFDTGAPNVISNAFAKKLNVSVVTSGNVRDSGGNVIAKQSFVYLDEVALGNVVFNNTGAIIQDLNASRVMRCLGIDGIIGANLMRKSYVKIDNTNNTITLTDGLENFGITEAYDTLNFSTNISGTPLVTLTLDTIDVFNVEFDTGSNGQISLPQSNLKKISKTRDLDKAVLLGNASYGVGGKSKNDTIQYAVIQELAIGSQTFTNQIVKFSTYGDTIGCSFLKNYTIVLDWVTNRIYLKENQSYDNSVINHFGFLLEVEDSGVFVGAIFLNSSSDGKLQLGDKILKINNTNIEQLTNEEVCANISNESWEYKTKDSLSITVERDGQLLEFELTKSVVLPSK